VREHDGGCVRRGGRPDPAHVEEVVHLLVALLQLGVDVELELRPAIGREARGRACQDVGELLSQGFECGLGRGGV
jgi:hypothetical protein